MTRWIRILLVVIAGFLALPTCAMADDGPPTFAGSFGVTFLKGGPHRSVSTALEGVGFGNPSGKPGPPVSDPLIDLMGQLHWRFHGRLAIGTVASRVRGLTRAERDATSAANGQVATNASAAYEIDTNAALASVWIGSHVRAGAGPALHVSRLALASDVVPGGRLIDLGQDASLGVVSAVTVMATRPHSPWTVELTVQHHHVAGRDLASTRASLSPGAIGNFDWPHMHVDFSHWTIGVSLGFRN